MFDLLNKLLPIWISNIAAAPPIRGALGNELNPGQANNDFKEKIRPIFLEEFNKLAGASAEGGLIMGMKLSPREIFIIAAVYTGHAVNKRDYPAKTVVLEALGKAIEAVVPAIQPSAPPAFLSLPPQQDHTYIPAA